MSSDQMPMTAGPDTAVVTGAAGGLGYRIGLSLMRAGHRVVFTDISADALDALTWPDDVDSDMALTMTLDVTKKGDFERVLTDVLAQAGSVEILVNCAALTRTTPVFDISPEEFSQVMDINLRSVFVGCQVFGAHFRSAGYGRIVNMASLAAQNGGTATGAHYAASKGGIITLTKVFARELAGDGVTCNAIAPGPLDVPLLRDILPGDKLAAMPGMIPTGSLGSPDFIGQIVSLMASREAGAMTGATVDANGGLYVR
ncbi:SDR family NAD(P)-dependent oxidoreductase [Croceicoccus sediminis]|uniref:SDR family NAD(P)-dependent oxidoreductase n=1 Tax=Croceicoccus sediminis TaxID=2571150 RepID=UPI001F1085B7|nr:SDR family oxidoreductase [Croceicoccus sediminis]